MARIKISIRLIVCIIIAFVGCVSSPAAGSEWKFAVVCDTRGDNNDTPGKKCINEYILKLIAQSIVNERCELVIVPGDMVNGWWANGNTSYGKQFQDWKKAMAPVYKKKIPVYTVRGNHEDGAGIAYPPQPPYAMISNPALKDAYLEAFGDDNPKNGPNGEKGLTYFFKYKNAMFAGIDEYVQPNRVNIKWFKGVLNENNRKKYPHVFAFGHAPAFKVNHPDCLSFYKKERDMFWDVFGENGGKIYFCGHDHLYNRASAKNSKGTMIYQVLVGSCGAPPKSWSPPFSNPDVTGHYHNETDCGYLVVTINNKKVIGKWKVWDSDGEFSWKTKDRFVYTLN